MNGWLWYQGLDEWRRMQGATLDALGFGPVETPHREVLRAPGVTLHRYGERAGETPVLLVVPAPIKRPYIWDLAPAVSAVRHCLAQGFRVYLAHWDDPGELGSQLGLEAYAQHLLGACLEAVRAETRADRIVLVAHSLGGTLATLFTALNPERVASLVLLASPLHFEFSARAGALGPLLGTLADADVLASAPASIPGSVLSTISFAAAPTPFGTERMLDWMGSSGDSALAATRFRVERWALDEVALAAGLVRDVLEFLYQRDGLMQGTLVLDGRRVGPAQVTVPVLLVADPRCQVVPAYAILPFFHAVPHTHKRLLWYRGDRGVGLQHVGMLVGNNAHRKLWPQIFAWIRGVAIPGGEVAGRDTGSSAAAPDEK